MCAFHIATPNHFAIFSHPTGNCAALHSCATVLQVLQVSNSGTHLFSSVPLELHVCKPLTVKQSRQRRKDTSANGPSYMAALGHDRSHTITLLHCPIFLPHRLRNRRSPGLIKPCAPPLKRYHRLGALSGDGGGPATTLTTSRSSVMLTVASSTALVPPDDSRLELLENCLVLLLKSLC